MLHRTRAVLLTAALAGCDGLGLGLVAPVVSITPSHPTTVDDLRAVLVDVEGQGRLDPDDYDLTWLRNGDVVEGLDAPVVRADRTDRDDAWTVTVVPRGKQGRVVPSAATVVIGNAPPQVGEVSITPDPAHAASTLRAEVAVEDPDGDDVEVVRVWKVDGEIVPGEVGRTLDHGFERGSRVKVEVTVSDGHGAVLERSASTVIANAPPAPPEVQITSYLQIAPTTVPPGRAPILCGLSFEPTDADGDEVSADLWWTVNGEPYVGSNDGEGHILYEVAAQRAGDHVVCTGQLTDGETPSAPAVAEVAVENSGYLDAYEHLAITGSFTLDFEGSKGACGAASCDCTVQLAGTATLRFGVGSHQVYDGAWARTGGDCRVVTGTGVDAGTYYLMGFPGSFTSLHLNPAGTRLVGFGVVSAPSLYEVRTSYFDVAFFSGSAAIKPGGTGSFGVTGALVNDFGGKIGQVTGTVELAWQP